VKLARTTVLASLIVGLVLTSAALAQMAPSTTGQRPNSSSAEQGNRSSQATSPTVLVDPGKLYNEKTPTEWVGKSVVLQNVQVQDTNDTGNFWVGSDDDHRLLVVKADNPNLSALRFHKGDIVTVTGVVRPASQYMAGQTTASSGSMKDALNSSSVFLLANEISVSSSTQH